MEFINEYYYFIFRFYITKKGRFYREDIATGEKKRISEQDYVDALEYHHDA